MMVFSAAGFAPRAKYSAQTMKEHQTAKFQPPSYSENGTETTTVIATASQSGMVSLYCAS